MNALSRHAGNDSLAAALATCGDWQVSGPGDKPEVVRRIETGLSNTAYLLEWAGRRLVLRLSSSNPALGLDRDTELRVLRSAHAAALAPAVIFADHERNILVTEFVSGRHWSVEEAGRLENIERLAVLLKCIHALPPIARKLRPQQVADRYWQALANLPGDALVTPLLRRRLDQIMDQAQQFPHASVLCHNDLMLSNIVDDGQRSLVLDWEYSGMGDPMFEIAVIVHNHQLDTDQTRWLLQCYFGSLDASERLHFFHNQAVYLYLDMLWYAVQSVSTPQSKYVTVARAKAAALARLLQNAANS